MLTARVAEVDLGNNESYQRINEQILAMNHLTNGKSNSFVEAACWADDIRS